MIFGQFNRWVKWWPGPLDGAVVPALQVGPVFFALPVDGERLSAGSPLPLPYPAAAVMITSWSCVTGRSIAIARITRSIVTPANTVWSYGCTAEIRPS